MVQSGHHGQHQVLRRKHQTVREHLHSHTPLSSLLAWIKQLVDATDGRCEYSRAERSARRIWHRVRRQSLRRHRERSHAFFNRFSGRSLVVQSSCSRRFHVSRVRQIEVDGHATDFSSGTSIARFPKGGYLVRSFVRSLAASCFVSAWYCVHFVRVCVQLSSLLQQVPAKMDKEARAPTGPKYMLPILVRSFCRVLLSGHDCLQGALTADAIPTSLKLNTSADSPSLSARQRSNTAASIPSPDFVPRKPPSDNSDEQQSPSPSRDKRSASPSEEELANRGRVLVYGDSNCMDMNHRTSNDCFWLVLKMME